jgi:hypothetical protein
LAIALLDEDNGIAVVAKTILMNMSVPEVDLVSLVSRISLLEERQNLLAKYTVNVKRQLERLIERFNTRSELPMLENLQEAIAQLCEKLTSWQQQQHPDWQQEQTMARFVDWNGTFDTFDSYESLNGIEPFEMPVMDEELANRWVNLEEAECDADEQTILGLKRVREYEIASDTAQMTMSPSAASKAIGTGEFLRLYNDQKRDFTGANLSGINLAGKFLSYDLNLSQANLSQAKLAQANLSGVNLSRANLRALN